MTANNYDKLRFFGVGIPEEPDVDNIKPVLESLHIGTGAKWIRSVGHTPECVFVDMLRWNDGKVPRKYRL